MTLAAAAGRLTAAWAALDAVGAVGVDGLTVDDDAPPELLRELLAAEVGVRAAADARRAISRRSRRPMLRVHHRRVARRPARRASRRRVRTARPPAAASDGEHHAPERTPIRVVIR